MKFSPGLIALGAAGVAALLLFRAAGAKAPASPGLFDRAWTLADRVAEGVATFTADSGEYLRWGSLSAVVDDKGRRVETVPLPDLGAGFTLANVALDGLRGGVGALNAAGYDPWFTPPGAFY